MDIYKFFDKSSKKRDLSDKSTNGEDPKKQREGSLDEQESPDEVFKDSLDSPDCVKILFNCMQNIERKLEVLDFKLEATHHSHIKGESQLSSLHETVEFLSKKFDDLAKEKDEQIKNLTEKDKELKKIMKTSKSSGTAKGSIQGEIVFFCTVSKKIRKKIRIALPQKILMTLISIALTDWENQNQTNNVLSSSNLHATTSEVKSFPVKKLSRARTFH